MTPFALPMPDAFAPPGPQNISLLLSATPDERARIREAMERIFDGTARSSTGP